AGAALELGVRREQRQIAGGAGEDALALLVIERAGAGALGTVLAQHVVLLRVEPLAPLGVGDLAEVDILRCRCHFFCLAWLGLAVCTWLAECVGPPERRKCGAAGEYCASVDHITPLRRAAGVPLCDLPRD